VHFSSNNLKKKKDS